VGDSGLNALEGVRVLECSRILAGPLCTQILADLGADVLKIEPPRGDDTRHWGPPFKDGMSAYFESCNRNKSSMVLDIKDPDDYRQLQRLVRAADVWVDNFVPALARRLNLTSELLHAWNPCLVRVGICGYRRGTRREDEPGYDLMIQAESGVMGITGAQSGAGHKVGVALVDVMTGMMAANAVLAALFQRERGGPAADLHVSLYQTALFSLVNVAANHLQSGEPTPRWGNSHPNIVPYRDYRARDGALVIGAGNDRQFHRLCELLGLQVPEGAWAQNADRVADRSELDRAIAFEVGSWSRTELLTALKAARIPAAPILRPDEALGALVGWDPQGILVVGHGDETRHMVANPIVADFMRSCHNAPPNLGQGGREMAERWLKQAR